MIFQNCVVCGKPVDVDNCFGSIGVSETYCDDHEDVRLAMIEIEKIGNEIHTLKIHYDNAYKKIRNKICKAEKLNRLKNDV